MLKIVQNPKLLAFVGLKKSGKDEAAKQVLGILGSNWEVLRWSKKLKEMASMLTGTPLESWESQEFKEAYLESQWDMEGMDCYLESLKIPMTGRVFLQKLGEGLRSCLSKDIWINSMTAEINSLLQDGKGVCLVDSRYRNEIKVIQEKGGVIIRITNPRVKDEDSHISEQELKLFRADYDIINDGDIPQLRQKIQELLQTLKLL